MGTHREAFLSCAAARGTTTRGGRARRTATGGRGLTVTGTTVFGSLVYTHIFRVVVSKDSTSVVLCIHAWVSCASQGWDSQIVCLG